MFRPYVATIDRTKRILEIGPLTTPMIPKIPGQNNVFYADIRSTEDNREFYKDASYVDGSKIADIDFVIKETYTESIQDAEKFDYVIASHVIEHIPELISFFQDIANVMTPSGKLCLTIPDKRYCFDHYRYPTSFAAFYDIYKNKVPNSPHDVLDQICSSNSETTNDPVVWWAEQTNYHNLIKRREDIFFASQVYEDALQGKYIDVHFSVFTPESFLLFVYQMIAFNLFPFECAEFYPTQRDTFEFNVVLQKNNKFPDADEAEWSIQRERIIELLERNNAYEKELETADILEANNYNKIKQELESIRASKSWKITSAFRKLHSILKK
jgi:SAM-dependent methyltransferase